MVVALRYVQVVRRKKNDKVFHDQTGYWMWDAERDLVMQSLTIPRGVCVLAGGEYTGDGPVTLKVRSKHDDPDWSLTEAPFMRDQARTLSFTHELTVDGDRMTYAQTTLLDIYGREFEHTDENVLTRQ